MRTRGTKAPGSIRFVVWALTIAVGACLPFETAQAQPWDVADPARSGRGWSMINLDVDVTIAPKQKGFHYEGVLRLRLDGMDRSYGPLLLMNARTHEGRPGIDFESAASQGAEVEIGTDLVAGSIRHASVRFAEPRVHGDEIEVRIRCRSAVAVGQMGVTEDAAVASWTAMWLPWTIRPAEGEVEWNAGASAVGGVTKLKLPRGWVGIVDGEVLQRETSRRGATETWKTPAGVARSFAAGPFEVSTHDVHGRQIRTYLLPGTKAIGPERVASLLGEAIAAQEKAFGPFPFTGPYSVVEFPRTSGQWFGTASQQTFVLAQPPSFDFEHGNLQLWAHEAAHAWWANTVGTRGRGAKWCGESLAELGAIVAYRAIEGEQATLDLLNYGREGMDPFYNAAGYFALVRQGQDMPIATMGNGGVTHALANSKGVWIYRMLHVMLGEDRFFDVLRDLVKEFAHREMGADDVRARFVDAAPEYPLEQFFAQWLDRAGAPVIQVEWHAAVDGRSALVKLTQTQSGEPFVMDLDIALTLVDGTHVVETVHTTQRSEAVRIQTPARPLEVRLDPGHKILMWRPEYGPHPTTEIITAEEVVPEPIRRAIVGRYRFRVMNKEIRVFERDGAVYAQPEGAGASRLLHQMDGVFHVDGPGDPIITEFDLSTSPSPTLKSIEGKAGVYVADRIPEE